MFEAGEIDRDAAFPCNVGGEVEGEAEGIVELENGFAVQHLVFGGHGHFQHAHAVFQGFGEAFLLLSQYGGDAILRVDQFRIGQAHDSGEVGDQPVEEG